MSGTDEIPDDNALAAEFVLRLMSDEDRRSFAARVASEPALAALVRAWEADLSELAEEVAEVAPPARLKRAITVRLFPQARARGGAFWRRVWAGVAVAALVGALVLVQVQQPAEPLFVAEVTAEDRGLVLRAAYTRDGLVVDRLTGEVQAGRTQELWVIAEGAAPVSLGLLESGSRSRIAVPADLELVLSGATLAVSDEPPGGSPTGQPTGAVLAAGVFVSR